ncbi:MAG: exostosin family protein [Planctomycetaceae bacterium]|nr:exostosin family protein [Planctomycetaceae bacterium]
MAELSRSFTQLPERCVLLSGGVPIECRDRRLLICNSAPRQDSGVVAIPYMFEDKSHPVPFNARRHFAGFQGTVVSNPPLRQAVVEGFSGCECALCQVNRNYFYYLDHVEQTALRSSYWEGLSQTQFSLCPAGDNLGSVRFYESLAAGCIPVLLADHAELPLSTILPWDDMIVRVPEADARQWQSYVAAWQAKRCDHDLAMASEHNRRTWLDWLHWSRLGKQLLVEWVERAIQAAESRDSLLSRAALSLQGMSSGKVRHFLNNLRPRRYLEVGVWRGSTFVAACFGRQLASATAIDNFGAFQQGTDGAEQFQANANAMLPNQPVTLRTGSFFDLPADLLPQNVDVFFYDGDHRPEAQREAMVRGWPLLADEAVVVVDDTNFPGVVEATRQGLAQVKADVVHEWLLPARFNGDTEQWWNGLYVAVIAKNAERTRS